MTREGLGFFKGCDGINKNLGTLNGNFIKEGENFLYCGFPKPWVGKDGNVIQDGKCSLMKSSPLRRSLLW